MDGTVVMPSPAATQWLPNMATKSPDGTYHHFHVVENDSAWDGVRNELVGYFNTAHADAKKRLERLTGVSLHPSGAPTTSTYAGYPYALPGVTLQGYFGEVMAGWFAENHTPCGLPEWFVPAHLFRYHLTAFQYLELLAQTGAAPGAIVGRTGDDCLAFRRNASGLITDVLYCEAKCTQTHSSKLIRDAHDKAAAGAIADIPQLIEILLRDGSTEALSWVDSLRALHMTLAQGPGTSVIRHDLVCYVHGQAPRRQTTWISPTAKHSAYTAQRVLNVVELRLADVLDRIGSLYASEVWT